MPADVFIQCRVTPDMKELVRELARRERITESALVKQLLDGCAVLDARERGWILECDFAVFGPTEGGGAMGECSAFTMQDCTAAAYPHDGGVARCSVGLLAGFDRRHDGARGDKPFLSPLCLP